MITDLKPYPKYKDSGVPWLGEVPEHWDITHVRRLFKIQKRIAGMDGYDVLSITQQGIKVKDISSGVGQLSMDYSKYQFVEVGDFAMNHMDLLTGYVDISNRLGVTSPDYRVFRLVDNMECSARYYLYLFQNAYRNRLFFPFGQGSAQLGRWRLPRDEFYAFHLPRPTFQEQSAIVRFLDHADRKIRRFIHAKQKLIKLLEEQKRAIIHEAVALGTDPNVKTKSTEFPWISLVPKHWEVSRVKNEFKCLDHHRIPLSAIERGEMASKQYEYYGASGIIDKVENYLFDDNLLLIAEDGANLVLRNLPLAIIARGKFWVNNHAHILKPKRGNIKYLAHAMERINYVPWISGAAQPKLTQDRLMSIPIAIPQPEEQNRIIERIESEVTPLSNTIGRAKSEMRLLKEFNTCLIADVVTGKLDVRQAAAKLPDIGEEPGLMEETDIGEETDTIEE